MSASDCQICYSVECGSLCWLEEVLRAASILDAYTHVHGREVVQDCQNFLLAAVALYALWLLDLELIYWATASIR